MKINKKEATHSGLLLLESGGDLLSRAVSSQVPSALKGLTSVFGMGTGGTPSPLPPEIVSSHSLRFRLPMLASPALLAGSASQTFRFVPYLWGPRSVIIHSSYLPKVSFCPLEVFLFLRAFAPAFRAAHPSRLHPFGYIKFNACCAFTLRYSRPLSHLDNCTVKKKFVNLVGPYRLRL